MWFVVVSVGAVPATAHSASQKSASAVRRHTSASKSASAKAPSAAEIAAAKASGKVWVNLNTGIYHQGGRWYGKTKHGKFLTPDEAKKAGYRPAKRD